MSTSPTADPATLTGSWSLDPDGPDRLTLTAKHLFGLGTVTATVALRSATIDAEQGPQSARVEVVADPATFQSGNATRDSHVTGTDFLDAATHAAIRFTGGGARRVGDRWEVAGELTARGTTRPVVLDLAVVPVAPAADGAARVRVHGETVVDRTEHGMTKKRGMAGRRIRLAVDVTLRRA